MKQFRSFEEMTETLGFLTFKELKKITNSETFNQFEEHGEYPMIQAHGESYMIVSDLMNKNNLHVVTYTIEGDEDGTVFTYESGFRYVNREGFFLCKSESKGIFIDKIEDSELE